MILLLLSLIASSFMQAVFIVKMYRKRTEFIKALIDMRKVYEETFDSCAGSPPKIEDISNRKTPTIH